MPRPTLSLVLPVYNEEEVIPILHDRLQEFLSKVGVETEVVFVNDGSRDRSLPLLRDLVMKDPRYKVVSFSRNFGHGNAITAGVDYARGHAVVIMDADLQDPPEVIVKMLERWREGYDVVYGQRLKREGETWFKLLTARWFYRLLRALVPINVPLDTGDFRLMSRQVVVTLRALRETHRFVRGIVAWIGFRQIAVFYDRPSRAAGETKYPLSKMVRFALDAITSFSVVPLRLSTYLGVLISVGSILVALWAVIDKYVFHSTVQGWTSTAVLVSLLSSVQLVMIGILGEYVGRIYEQVKGRPLYLVAETLNIPREVDTDELEAAPHPKAAAAWPQPAAPPVTVPSAAPVPLFPPLSIPTPGPGGAPGSVPPPPLQNLSAPPPAAHQAGTSPHALAPAVQVPAAPHVAAPVVPHAPASSPGGAVLPPPPPLSLRSAPPSSPQPGPASTRPPPVPPAPPRSVPPPLPPSKPKPASAQGNAPKSLNPMKATIVGTAVPSPLRTGQRTDDDTRPEQLPRPPSREGEE